MGRQEQQVVLLESTHLKSIHPPRIHQIRHWLRNPSWPKSLMGQLGDSGHLSYPCWLPPDFPSPIAGPAVPRWQTAVSCLTQMSCVAATKPGLLPDTSGVGILARIVEFK